MSGFVVFGRWTADGQERDVGRKEKGERLDGGKEREDVDVTIQSDGDQACSKTFF